MSRFKLHSYVTYFPTCIVQLTHVLTILKFNSLSVGRGCSAILSIAAPSRTSHGNRACYSGLLMHGYLVAR